MEKLSNRFKGVFIQTFKESDTDYSDMTIKELVETFEKQLDSERVLRTDNESKILKKYNNIYLKKIELMGLFGRTLEVVKIDSIKRSVPTDSNKTTYIIKGHLYRFNPTLLSDKKFDFDSVNSVFTEEDLSEFTEITKEDYDSYVTNYHIIKDKLAKMLS